MTTIHPSTLKAIKNLKAPAAPLKGRGYAREDFDFPLSHKLAKQFWEALPRAHKNEVAARRSGSHFSWARVISPEAAKKGAKVITAIAESLKQGREAKEAAFAAKTARDEARHMEQWTKATCFADVLDLIPQVNTAWGPQIEGELLTFTARKGAKASLTFEQAQAAAIAGRNLHQAAFCRVTGEAKQPTGGVIRVKTGAIWESQLTADEIAEFTSLVEGQTHPVQGRAMELKNKSGMTWNQLTHS